MNNQMVSVTDLQRNLKKVLENVAVNPQIVLRDSVPEAVIVSFSEFQRLSLLEKNVLKDKLSVIMADLVEKNKDFSDEEIDRDIEYARKHAPRRN